MESSFDSSGDYFTKRTLQNCQFVYIHVYLILCLIIISACCDDTSPVRYLGHAQAYFIKIKKNSNQPGYTSVRNLLSPVGNLVRIIRLVLSPTPITATRFLVYSCTKQTVTKMHVNTLASSLTQVQPQ